MRRIGNDDEPLFVTGTRGVRKLQGPGLGDHILPGITIDIPAVCLRGPVCSRRLVGAQADAPAQLGQHHPN